MLSKESRNPFLISDVFYTKFTFWLQFASGHFFGLQNNFSQYFQLILKSFKLNSRVMEIYSSFILLNLIVK